MKEIGNRWKIEMPEGGRFLALHRPAGADAPHAIVLKTDGRLVYSRQLPAAAPDGTVAASWNNACQHTFGAVERVVAVGDWLAVLDGGRIYHLLWSGSGYRWLGEPPAAPAAVLKAVPRALPPYSYSDSELPRFNIQAPDGTDPQALINARMEEFLKAVKAAGLYFDQVSGAACWRLADGTLWLRGEPQTAGEGGSATLRTVSSTRHDGVTYLTLELSRAPFSVEAAGAAVPPAWSGVIAGVDIALGNEGSAPLSSPEVAGAMGADGTPGDIHSIGGRLYITSSGSVEGSLPAWPFARPAGNTAGALLPSPARHIAGALRSSTGGEPGLPQLYIFCDDGVRLLTPGSGGYKGGQLISRHVAIGTESYAPLPGATAFLTRGGVMSVAGSGVSDLGLPEGWQAAVADRLLYIYEDDILLLYRPKGQMNVYDLKKKKWGAGKGIILERHYAWPEAWTQAGGSIGPVETVDVAEPSDGSDGSDGSEGSEEPELPVPVPVKIYPVKLSQASQLRKIEEIEAMWPDGSLWPLKLYGALIPGKWRFLGMAPRGRMRLRGSGWRLFKVETFANSTSKGTLMPQIFIKFAT